MSLSIPSTEELNSYKVIASIAASNPYWRKLGGNGNDQQILGTLLSIILLGREFGIGPMQSLSGGIQNINGKFELSARILNTLVRKNGHCMKVVVSTEEVCQIWGKRRDTEEEMVVNYTMQEALRAGLVREGGGWRKHPSDMLFARAMSRLVRRLFPDCVGEAYIEGELQDTMLKKAVDAPEISTVEMEKAPPTNFMSELKLEYDPDIDESQLKEFILQSASLNGADPMAVVAAANANPGKFLDRFQKWAEKNKPTTQDLTKSDEPSKNNSDQHESVENEED